MGLDVFYSMCSLYFVSPDTHVYETYGYLKQDSKSNQTTVRIQFIQFMFLSLKTTVLIKFWCSSH